MSKEKQVILYTDGACIKNPGPGGYGAILIAGGQRKEISAGYQLTTNNRMEIMAVIAGLQALRFPCSVTVYSDSRYVVDSMSQGWVRRWRANGWRRSDNQGAVNTDLWEQLLTLCEQHHVTFEWIKGHAGHPENERCDRMSVLAASGKALLEDDGYAPGATSRRIDAVAPTHGHLFSESLGASDAASIAPLLPSVWTGKPDNRAVSIRCDATWMYITFRDRRELRVPLEWFPPLLVAPSSQRAGYTLEADGHRVRFSDLGLDIRVAQFLGIASGD